MGLIRYSIKFCNFLQIDICYEETRFMQSLREHILNQLIKFKTVKFEMKKHKTLIHTQI